MNPKLIKPLALLLTLGSFTAPSFAVENTQFALTGKDAVPSDEIEVMTDMDMINVRSQPILFRNGGVLVAPNSDGFNPNLPLCSLSEADDSTMGAEAAPKGSIYSVTYAEDPNGVNSAITIPAGQKKPELTLTGRTLSIHLSGSKDGKQLQALNVSCLFPHSLPSTIITDRTVTRILGSVIHFQGKTGVAFMSMEDAKKKIKDTVVKESVEVTANICDDNPMFEMELVKSLSLTDKKTGEVLIYSEGKSERLSLAQTDLANLGKTGCGLVPAELPGAVSKQAPVEFFKAGEKLISCERQLTASFDHASGLLKTEIVLSSMRANAKLVCFTAPQADASGNYKIKFDLGQALRSSFNSTPESTLKVDVLRKSETRMITQ